MVVDRGIFRIGRADEHRQIAQVLRQRIDAGVEHVSERDSRNRLRWSIKPDRLDLRLSLRQFLARVLGPGLVGHRAQILPECSPGNFEAPTRQVAGNNLAALAVHVESHRAACALDKQLVGMAAPWIALFVDANPFEQQDRAGLANRIRQLDVIGFGAMKVDVKDDQLGVPFRQQLEQAGIYRPGNVVDVDGFLQQFLGALGKAGPEFRGLGIIAADPADKAAHRLIVETDDDSAIGDRKIATNAVEKGQAVFPLQRLPGWQHIDQQHDAPEDDCRC